MRRNSCKSGSSCCSATHTSIESFLNSASDTAGVFEELLGLKGKHVRRDGECLYTFNGRFFLYLQIDRRRASVICDGCDADRVKLDCLLLT